MKKSKRVLSLLVALLMTVPMLLTGCGDDEEKNADLEATKSIRQNVTLNMYILTEKETTEEQAKAVQMAINEITLPRYKTTIKINYLTEDNYWDAIDEMEAQTVEYQEQVAAETAAKIAAAKEANIGGNAIDKKKDAETEEELSEEEVDEEFNNLIDEIFESDDITLEHPQLDIFLVNSFDKFKELVSDNRLAPLDSYISLENKILNSYVYPAFLAAGKFGNGATYGIPVNKVIGEYEYFVFNKELLDKYGYKAEDFTDFDSLAPYLALIKANEPGFVPLTHATSPEGFDFYGAEGDALGTEKQDKDSAFPGFVFSMFEDALFKKHFETIRSYKLAGYIPDSYTESTPFAVDIRKGSISDPELWKEDGLECAVYKKPRSTSENTLDAVYVVSTYSANPSRATEIIRYLNTEPELVNLLQYGIEGVHYYYNKDTNEITYLDDAAGYKMKNEYTGNVYLKYTVAGEKNRTEEYKAQNLDSTEGAFLGFVPQLDDEATLVLEKANAITQSYYPGLLAGIYDTESVFAEIKAKLSNINIDAELAKLKAEQAADEKAKAGDEEKAEEEEFPEDDFPEDEPAEEETTEPVQEVEAVTRENEEEGPAVITEEGNFSFSKIVNNKIYDRYTAFASAMTGIFRKPDEDEEDPMTALLTDEDLAGSKKELIVVGEGEEYIPESASTEEASVADASEETAENVAEPAEEAPADGEAAA